MTKAEIEAETQAELDEVISKLRDTTPLVRLNLTEARAVFAGLDAIGYTVARLTDA